MNKEEKKETIQVFTNPIASNSLYTLFFEAKMNGVSRKVKLIKKKNLDNYQVKANLCFNQKIVEKIDSFVFKQAFLPQQFCQSKGHFLIAGDWAYRLDNIYLGYPLKQEIVREIFQTALKAVYSLYVSGIQIHNLRTEHFVRCRSGWKIQSFIGPQFIIEQDEGTFDVQYFYDPRYDPPPHYALGQRELQIVQSKITWSLMCILVRLIFGAHFLNDARIIQALKDQCFTWNSLKCIYPNIVDKISIGLKKIILKMHEHKRETRTGFIQLIKSGQFSIEVKKAYQKHEEKAKANPILKEILKQMQKTLIAQFNKRIEKYSVHIEGLNIYRNTLISCFASFKRQQKAILKLTKLVLLFSALQYLNQCIIIGKDDPIGQLIEKNQDLERLKIAAQQILNQGIKQLEKIRSDDCLQSLKYQERYQRLFKQDPLKLNFSQILHIYRNIIWPLYELVSKTFEQRTKKDRKLLQLKTLLAYYLMIGKSETEKNFDQNGKLYKKQALYSFLQKSSIEQLQKVSSKLEKKYKKLFKEL